MTSSSLHVVHVINRLSPTGGAEVSLVQILPHLRREGIRSTVVTLRPHVRGSRVAEARAAGADVVCLDASGLARCTARLTMLLPRLDADLVHTTLFDAGVAGRVAARTHRVPAVASVVNTVYAPGVEPDYARPVVRRVLREVDRQLARRATRHVHALTAFAATAAVNELGVSPEHIAVIPRGRDRANLGEPSGRRRAGVRRALGLLPDQPVVLAVGRQERQKAHEALVQAFRAVRAVHHDAVLLLAGRRGVNTTRIEEAIDAAGLDHGVVRLLGPRDDVPDLLCAADVFALPSAWEGLGGVVLEAMAMSTPVVTFDLPPVLEVLADTGLAVPAGDVDLLGRGIAGLLSDPARASVLAEAARARFEEQYRIELVAAQMADWYRNVRGAGVGHSTWSRAPLV